MSSSLSQTSSLTSFELAYLYDKRTTALESQYLHTPEAETDALHHKSEGFGHEV